MTILTNKEKETDKEKESSEERLEMIDKTYKNLHIFIQSEPYTIRKLWLNTEMSELGSRNQVKKWCALNIIKVSDKSKTEYNLTSKGVHIVANIKLMIGENTYKLQELTDIEKKLIKECLNMIDKKYRNLYVFTKSKPYTAMNLYSIPEMTTISICSQIQYWRSLSLIISIDNTRSSRKDFRSPIQHKKYSLTPQGKRVVKNVKLMIGEIER